jgi:hypothetical protein
MKEEEEGVRDREREKWSDILSSEEEHRRNEECNEENEVSRGRVKEAC